MSKRKRTRKSQSHRLRESGEFGDSIEALKRRSDNGAILERADKLRQMALVTARSMCVLCILAAIRSAFTDKHALVAAIVIVFALPPCTFYSVFFVGARSRVPEFESYIAETKHDVVHGKLPQLIRYRSTGDERLDKHLSTYVRARAHAGLNILGIGISLAMLVGIVFY